MSSTKPQPKGTYAAITASEWVTTVFVLLSLPVVVTASLLTSPWVKRNQTKTWRRVAGDSASRWQLTLLGDGPIQWLGGTTLGVYKTLMKQAGAPIIVEDLSPLSSSADTDDGEAGKLLWVGGKATGPSARVVLYFHGGAFLMPMQPQTGEFWRRAHEEWKEKHDIEVSFAMLNYSLVPDATFPVPLIQAINGLNRILSSGVRPENITLVGESAGGNLVLQVLSHLLHPMEGIVPSVQPLKLGGALLMSPWVEVTPTPPPTGSSKENADLDFITPTILGRWAASVRAGIAKEHLDHIQYLDSTRAPEGWFAKLNTIVERVCVTVGESEVLKDEGVALAERLQRECKESNIKLLRQKHGVHNDVFLDVFAGEKKRSGLGDAVADWVLDGYRS